MKRLPALACLLWGCTAAFGAEPDAGALTVGATLEPAKMHEECVRLEAGEKRSYHWKSSAPIDFNIHYHHGDAVLFPIKREGMRGDGGTFVAKTGEDYCWMWTARDKAAKIEGRIAK
jgi:hypothetical protein